MTLLYTLLTLLAFAGNSLLCRMALAEGAISPADFTWIRLCSGALTLIVCYACFNSLKKFRALLSAGSAIGTLTLFIYAAFFSYAYVDLNTATGALILFAVVQLTLVILHLRQGNVISAVEVMSVLMALTGLAILLLPSAASPSFSGLVLMVIAGVAWGLYTWFGKQARDAMATTTMNFVYCVPLCLVFLLFDDQQALTKTGVTLAISSGAITSGLGYALWYRVLPKLSTLQSGVAQLLVPVIAALAGFVMLDENLSMQFVMASALISLGLYLLNHKPSGQPKS